MNTINEQNSNTTENPLTLVDIENVATTTDNTVDDLPEWQQKLNEVIDGLEVAQTTLDAMIAPAKAKIEVAGASGATPTDVQQLLELLNLPQLNRQLSQLAGLRDLTGSLKGKTEGMVETVYQALNNHQPR